MAGTTKEKTRREHPGRGSGRARPVPKGRQVEHAALDDIRKLLGEAPRRRDLLIEHLHRIQDRFGQIGAAHLAALAEEMRLSQAEVFEVATFYAHFDVVKEGETPVPPVTVRVCESLTCGMHGGDALADALRGRVGPEVRILRAPCMGHCDCAPMAAVGHRAMPDATVASVTAALSQAGEPAEPAAGEPYDAYVAAGGYRLLADLRAGTLTSEAVLETLDAAGLRGLGGAGFPTARKWRAVRGEPGPRLMVVNADEGEPGTFKDRHLLERYPHRFLEGALIAAHVIEATDLYIYVRDEYPDSLAILRSEIARLPEELRGAGGLTIHLRRGAGAYICGEESALIESIEGKRGLPRHKPPYPFQAGLFGRPTLVNNVETVAWVPIILDKGAAWWNGQGRHGGRGLRAYSVSGRVRQPGVKIAPAGITLNELVSEHCGGMAEGHVLRAYLPGGASGGILPATMADLPLDFGKLEPHGCFTGSGAVVVLSDKDDLRGAALNLMRFFEDESCGQCTPCRVGTQKAVLLMERRVWDRALLAELAQVMRDASICGLGQAASNPLSCVMRYFPEEFAEGEAA